MEDLYDFYQRELASETAKNKGVRMTVPESLLAVIATYQLTYKHMKGKHISKTDVLLKLCAHGVEGLREEIHELKEPITQPIQ